MKLNKISSAFIISMGLAAFNAQAEDVGNGSVTFKGNIIDAPCSIHPESVNQEVELGQIASASLKGGGKSTPRFFNIKLENCSLEMEDTETPGNQGRETVANTVSIMFGGPEANTAKDLLAISGDAKGAGVAIENMLGERVVLGETASAQTLVAGENTLQLSAYLMGLGDDTAIAAGSFRAVTNFTLVYQ